MPSTRFLFWNINRKPLAAVVSKLADEHRVDVVVLGESNLTPIELLQALNRGQGGIFHHSKGSSKYVTLFTRFSPQLLRPVLESARVSIRRLSLPGRLEILLVAVQL